MPARRLVSRQIDYLDHRSPPRVLHFGEGLIEVPMPAGTRVIYPNPPGEPLANPGAAIRHALTHPEESEPLHALLFPGMKLTIAIDDISLPLPPMRTPDVRQLILEAVLELCADYGVDDVHLVVATALHRRMTEAEIRRMVGPRVFAAHWPARLYNHDAEDQPNMVQLGVTAHGEPVRISRRAAESDLVVYVNINLVPMDGGHKSLAVGLTDYEGLKAHHNPRAMRECHSYMDPSRSELHHSANRIGRELQKQVKVFAIETALDNRMFDGPMAFLGKREEELSTPERLAMEGFGRMLRSLPRAARRKVFHSVPAAYRLAAVHAGATEAVHKKILEKNFAQYFVPVKGQAEVLVCGVPFISPYNVNSILNPLLVQVMGLGYFFNMYRGAPLLKKGGVLILAHPMPDEFHADHHPSYIEFFHRLLLETRDSAELERRYQEQFAKNPSYVQLYRRGHAYHGAHPFYMWYWGDAGRGHAGQVIAAGAESAHVPERMGWAAAPDVTTAIEMAKSFLGKREPEITLLHHPPMVMVDVDAPAGT